MPPSGYFLKILMKGLLYMANSIYKTRTNYVHVSDEERFREICRLCTTSDGDRLTAITSKDDNGKPVIGFYTESDVDGYLLDENNNIADVDADDFDDESDYETSYDRFLKDIQSVLDPADALIITTIGYEKMRWLIGNTTIVTRNDIKYENLESLSLNMARKMLNKPEWNTKMYS